jgi:dihydrodipicolinate synthase/N-acetylneuraminate lyase
MLTASDLRGVYAIIPTPATPDAQRWDAVDTVDLAETERAIEALVRDGVQGLIVLGTTGECATITRDEFEKFVDCTLATVRKRVPTFVGTTQLGLHEVVYRTRFARDRGAEGILLGLPMWQPLTDEGAVDYYATMSQAFPDLAIMVYGNARAFRYTFPPVFWSRIRESAPTVMSAKFARPDQLLPALEAAQGRVHFLPHESALQKFYDLSPATTKACWSTACSMGPEPALAMMAAVLAGDVEKIAAIGKDLAWVGEGSKPLVSDRDAFGAHNIQYEKLRIAAAGYLNPGPIRPPYHHMPDAYLAMARQNGERWKSLRAKYTTVAR